MTNASLLSEAKQAIREKDREKAWRILHKYVSIEPDDIEAWLMLGGIASPESRLDYFRVAESIDPQDPRVIKVISWCEQRIPQKQVQESPPDMEKTAPHRVLPTIVKEAPESRVSHVEKQNVGEDVLVQEKVAVESKDESEASDSQKEPSIVLKWIKNICIGIFAVVMLILLIIGVSSLITGTEPQVLGRRFIIVTSGSMEPTFYTGSIIVVDTREGQTHELDDVVTFVTEDDPDMNVTHRIVNIQDEEGVQYYQTKGDNNDAADQTLITDENIIGEYTGVTVPLLGYFFSFIKSRNGILLMAFLFGLYLVITQVFKIKKLLVEKEV